MCRACGCYGLILRAGESEMPQGGREAACRQSEIPMRTRIHLEEMRDSFEG